MVLLATSLLLADGIALRHAQAFPHPTAAILLGMLLGQVGLIATWAACSRGSWMVRVMVAWAVIAFAAWPLSLHSSPTWQAWAGLLLIYSAVIVAGWKLTLAAGYCWKVETRVARHPQLLKPHQFSLAWLLKTSTACSLALGMFSWLALPAQHPITALASIMMLAACIPLTISALVLETNRWWLRGSVAMLMPLLGWLFVSMNAGRGAMLLTLMLGAQLLVAVLSALVINAAGMKLEGVKASTAQGEPESPLHPVAVL